MSLLKCYLLRIVFFHLNMIVGKDGWIPLLERIVDCLGFHLLRIVFMGVLFGCFARKIDGPRLPGGLIIYKGHLCPLKGHL